MTKTMKYLSMAAFVFAGAIMIGCSRENLPEIQPENQPEVPTENVVTLTTTISRDDDAQTRVLDENGKKKFLMGEQIAVVYQKTDDSFAKAVVTLNASDIDNEGKSATIRVTLTNPKTGGTVKYIYPAAMAKDNGEENFQALYGEQIGTLSRIESNFDYAKFEGTYDGTALPKGTLRNQLALCKFTIKDGNGTDITTDVTKLTIQNGFDVYHINVRSQFKIWVALKPITSGNIDIFVAKNTYLYRKTVTSNTTLAANTLTPITVTATQIPGALSGLFSLSNVGDLIYFSQGNLQAQWNGSSWGNWNFAAYEHDYIKDTQGNVKVDNPGNGDKIDLFGWSSYVYGQSYGINESVDDDKYAGDFRDWGTVNIQNGGGSNKWRTPSEENLDYILYQRISRATIAGVENARYMKVHLGAAGDNIKGVVLFPDRYVLPTLEHTDINGGDINVDNTPGVVLHWDDWGKMEAAGAVLLPAAGYRAGNEVTLKWNDYPVGNYWTSTDGGGGIDQYWGKCLEMEKISSGEYTFRLKSLSRHYGLSVRLIGPN